jgi:lactate dehydrogenase-like 2-hydroxyacid dehydrogenase
MKIAIFCQKTDFNAEQQEKLSELGEIVYADRGGEQPIEDWMRLAEGADILAIDPDAFGGFEKAQDGRLIKLMDSLPDLKGVALATTSFGWIDLDYCRKRNIAVTNVPFYSTESVAEHAIGLLIGLAKKIILTDRRTQMGKYRLDMGFELKGKTLGVIGLGHIGSRVAELGRAIGMKVIAYNRNPKQKEGVEMKSLDEVLAEADAISINLADSHETKGFIAEKEIGKMKPGAIVVNLASREIVDEKAMAKALQSGKISAYAFEGEDLESGPLAKIETAIGLKGFGWYTKEALEKAMEIWTKNIIALAKNDPSDRVD